MYLSSYLGNGCYLPRKIWYKEDCCICAFNSATNRTISLPDFCTYLVPYKRASLPGMFFNFLNSGYQASNSSVFHPQLVSCLCHLDAKNSLQICNEFVRFSTYLPDTKVCVFYGGVNIKIFKYLLKNECPHILVGTPDWLLALGTKISPWIMWGILLLTSVIKCSSHLVC